MYRLPKEGERLVRGFPALTKREMETAEKFFPHYLIYERASEGRRVWTTCCHKDGELFQAVPRIKDKRWGSVMSVHHNDETKCPFCHQDVMVKTRGKIQEGSKIRETYRPVLFLRASRDGRILYVQGFWLRMDLLEDPAGIKTYMPTVAYRFQEGEVQQWERERYDGWKMGESKVRFATRPFSGTTTWSGTPAYNVVGKEQIERTFLRYADPWKPLSKEESDLLTWTGKRKELVSAIDLAARYPRGYEMLRKAGFYEPLCDYIWNHKKNMDAIHWNETDPKKALGLNGVELKEFLDQGGTLQLLSIYRSLKRLDPAAGLTEVREWYIWLGGDRAKNVLKKAAGLKNLKPGRLMRYLKSFSDRPMNTIAQMWIDYITFAKRLGYDLTNPIHQMPRELEKAHDEAAAAAVVIDLERRDKAEERGKACADQKTANRVPALQKRYGYESEHYIIRPPESAEEIVREGKVLCHCVGGYAARHAKGKTTILFLRNKLCPDAPLCTIEMHGDVLAQVHGYRNECVPCPENPHRRPAKELYAEILTPWLAWVEAGSKRDRDGKPKLSKNKKMKKEVHVA